jgi:hypothetical protein
MQTITCKKETDELSYGTTYEVLDARSWGFRIQPKPKAPPAWYDRELFSAPRIIPDVHLVG